MKVIINVTDPEGKQREIEFWLSVINFIEPFALWYIITSLHSVKLVGILSIAILATFLAIRFVSSARTIIYPLVWGFLLYSLFGELTWIKAMAIGLVVYGRYWLIKYFLSNLEVYCINYILQYSKVDTSLSRWIEQAIH
ncbi:hypothetical protein EDC32_101959 [Laceyella sacchari]|uniref:hypothetical protein n=1 Tax=Laceyella sacchari TaxID=37482 RepID=UPI001052B45C|nr:hypothetical protein [Laceyella sacchari]TCW41297.1 hypothetical protein EDC32_101959 [Laceyella sacchari]